MIARVKILVYCAELIHQPCSDQDKLPCVDGTDQRQQQRVEVCGGAAGVHAEHLAALLQPMVDGAPQARQQHLALPQTVDVNRKSSQVLREDQLQDTHTQSTVHMVKKI